MKYINIGNKLVVAVSHPARGAWIEMPRCLNPISAYRSHPARGAWIEIVHMILAAAVCQSHPARGAWIEIADAAAKLLTVGVAPRKGCVD